MDNEKEIEIEPGLQLRCGDGFLHEVLEVDERGVRLENFEDKHRYRTYYLLWRHFFAVFKLEKAE